MNPGMDTVPHVVLGPTKGQVLSRTHWSYGASEVASTHDQAKSRRLYRANQWTWPNESRYAYSILCGPFTHKRACHVSVPLELWTSVSHSATAKKVRGPIGPIKGPDPMNPGMDTVPHVVFGPTKLHVLCRSHWGYGAPKLRAYASKPKVGPTGLPPRSHGPLVFGC
jgi:hypothetical protein